MSNIKTFKNLTLCGGGIHGLAYTSAFKAMNNLGKMNSIEKVIGTSVGSMFGVFVACKLTNAEIDNYTEKFYDELTNLPESVIQQGYNMYQKLGLHDNKNIYKVINQLLFDKFGVHDMTFQQLFDATKVEYTAVTMCLNTRQAVYLNYKSHPDLAVGKAIQMSSAVPFFFVQVKWHGQAFCDGGALDNMPIDYFDFANGAFNDETLAMHFLTTGVPAGYKTDTMLAVLEGIESGQISNNEAQAIQNSSKRNIIEIDVGQIESFNFELSKKEKNFLLLSGYNSVITYFAKLDQQEDTNKLKLDKGWGVWAKSWIWNSRSMN